MSNWVTNQKDNDAWGSRNSNNKTGWDDNEDNQNNNRDANYEPTEQQVRKSSYDENSKEKKMSRKLGRILVLSTFFSVVVATLGFRLYFGSLVSACVKDTSNRLSKNPEWKERHKTRDDLNPTPDEDELTEVLKDEIFGPCILLPIICSITQLTSLIILLKSKMQKPKWGKQLTMAIMFLIAGTSCVYSVICALLNLMQRKLYCIFWVTAVFPTLMMLSLGGHCFVCYIVFSTKAEHRIEENLKEIMDKDELQTNRQDLEDFRASSGGIPPAGSKVKYERR
ncbi:Oidioi.mRNA.OKI2018_I69.chr2.g7255.t1.cds [Oikopleura dioica]|uniref:Oidioi.mRNA.OKI2018_I69.chr2.g7255.t1.cds n=1 Tax=Oikopleura dioica TaxID=34765 RepID=A0ABN7T676_OIKDI|nr:Oidioi.mRNA.OKI2018_I69.chr2.g7255.t1.cds [Oikopleura dioica]